MIRLNEANLRHLPAEVARPWYARSNLRTGIVHLGLGAFHRAHQALFTNDCLNAGETDWGIARHRCEILTHAMHWHRRMVFTRWRCVRMPIRRCG